MTKNLHTVDIKGNFVSITNDVTATTLGLSMYKKNSMGHFVPLESVKPADIARDDFVHSIMAKVLVHQEALKKFKAELDAEVDQFITDQANRHSITMGGEKGGVTISNFDGSLKIVKSFGTIVRFDEGLLAAKEQIDRCIHLWSKGVNVEIRTLVEHAFQTDKQGNINIGRIYSLMQVQINDPEWQKAITALRESMQTYTSKFYFRFYEREQKTNPGEKDKYAVIPLDLSAL